MGGDDVRIEQCRWTAVKGWEHGPPGGLEEPPQLVLVFGAGDLLRDAEPCREARGAYPDAHWLGCSTAGDIFGTEVSDDSLVVTAIHFERTRLQACQTHISGPGDSFAAGERLGGALAQEDLVHVFLLSDGLNVNGSELVEGITSRLPSNVTVTGGLSGDGPRFQETLVIAGGAAAPSMVAVVGLYGPGLSVGFGSLGGWDAFGPERRITRSAGNVLYELDGRSALELYKTYLGPYAKDLPASGLLFPLSIRTERDQTPIVRTILAVDEEEQSMTFAGDVPMGTYARFMKANFDRLIDGAMDAARTSHEAIGSVPCELAILVSCVGRKLALGQRIEEEVEGVREVLGDGPVLAGFYSYGEISPFVPSAKCELHNQTMTITTLREWREP
jgi:hypothetical protein